MKVEFYKHSVGQEELDQVAEVVKGIFLTTGPKVEEFEGLLAKYLGVKHAIGMMSCTSSLQIALLAAGIGPGDEVITTPMSFVATANAVCQVGAKPIFVDVEPQTGNIDVSLIEQEITDKTKAILPVHLYGQMVDMDSINKIADKHNLTVIEDAAHALESERDGIRPGTKSFGAGFSFYATKNITSGEGGAFVTNDDSVAKAIRQLRSHGITSEVAQRHRTGKMIYDIDRLGWKSNMDSIKAAFLVPQIKSVKSAWARRDIIDTKYRAAFKKMNIDMPEISPNSTHAHHLFTIWIEPSKRDQVLQNLINSGIGCTKSNYPPIHLFSYYRERFGFSSAMFPVSESIGERTISLPLYPKLEDNEVDYVIEQVKYAISRD